MAFVHSSCYLNRPNTSKTHHSDDLFINAVIMQLNLHIKLTSRSSNRALARKSVSVIAAKCDVTTALDQNDVKKS